MRSRRVFDVVLFEPEIPANTGNVIRLCANTGARLHLIQPLGFVLDDRRLRRAGLDYHEYAEVTCHASLADYLEGRRFKGSLWALTTKAERNYAEPSFQPGDAFLFGPETRGLPQEVLLSLNESHRLRLPMRPGSRSLNLSNAVAVVVFEAWRQSHYA